MIDREKHQRIAVTVVIRAQAQNIFDLTVAIEPIAAEDGALIGGRHTGSAFDRLQDAL